MIKIVVSGIIEKDATIRDVNGDTVINFTVLHTNGLEGDKERKSWVKCSIWGRGINILDELKHGVAIFVEGTPSSEAYKGQDGTPKSNLKCTVSTYIVLNRQADSNEDNTDAELNPKKERNTGKDKVEIKTTMSIEQEIAQRQQDQDDLPF
jgi:single-stranded DNA-binding protein